MSDFYDDKEFSYDRYWQHREYEHASEVLAIHRLLSKKKFARAADIGGGFGRLTKILAKYSEEVTLVEPSNRMRGMAKDFLRDISNAKIVAGSAKATSLTNASQNLVVSVRVLHHITDLPPVFSEFARITKPHGLLLIEFANSLNIKARLRSLISGKPILRTPIDLRSAGNIKRQSIPFVNHHPEVIFKLLVQNNFRVKQILSVSNLRSPFLKKLLPTQLVITLEYFLQIPLSWLYFGPSIFILSERVDI